MENPELEPTVVSSTPPENPMDNNQNLIPATQILHSSDLKFVAVGILFPIIYIFYLTVNLDNSDPWFFLDYNYPVGGETSTLFAVLWIIVSFGLVGWCIALLNRTPSPKFVFETIGILSSACLCWILLGYNSIIYYIIPTAMVVTSLALCMFVPHSRVFAPVIFALLLWNFFVNPGDSITSLKNEYFSESTLVQSSYHYSRNISLEGLFFLFALMTSFISRPNSSNSNTSGVQKNHNLSAKKPLQKATGYVTIDEAFQAVLPAIGLIFLSGGVGGIIMFIDNSIASVMVGILISSVGITVAQFKLIADAINRGIRASNDYSK